MPLRSGPSRTEIDSSGWAWTDFCRRVLCRGLAAATALAGMLSVAMAAPGGGERFDELLNGFVEAALRGDDGRPAALRRWEAPLRLRLVGEPGELGTFVVAALRRLAHIADLAVEVLPPGSAEAENLLIVLDAGPGYRVKGRDAGCYTRVRFDGQGALTHAEVRINTRHAGRNGACAVHELMHALGFPGHPQRLQSVLNITEGIVAATEEDTVLLKLLYAPGLELGRPEQVTIARIRGLLARQLDATPAAQGRAVGP
ncbi:DUF2927 domain-containing protein [Desertibaculum subflavum]|uniref:DUF2927 domain-containing protein n=1 Tax=Desertibaculum subflavum TaxID=2268458 RepID=UPI0013C4BFF3